MTEGIDGLNQTFITLDSYLGSYGIHPPSWVYILIIIIILLGAIIYSLDIIISRLGKVIQFVSSYFYDSETKNFIEVRNSFVGHLEHEVEKLNRESDWDDSLHYTELEAEVEVRHYIDLDPFQSKNPIVWFNNLIYIMRNIKGIKSLEKIEKNLTQAIISSKSQVFIIIGDPGSGKTVSLRHVFLEMSKKAKNSKRKSTIVPIYLNLKQLNIEPDEITADKLHSWIIDQLKTNKDRNICEFVDNNFKQMLKKGQFFFLFDSFDEIPSVMDAQEENEVISKYSEAIDSFLHAESKRKGLVSSRPYRSPRKLDAQTMTILPLSNKRIKKALGRYLRKSSLSGKIWDDLLQREDLLHVVRNPFYLALLTQYCKKNEELPERHFDLFEQFVKNRAKIDEDRLCRLGFTPEELIQHAEILAFAMTITPNIGLEADINQIRNITNTFDKIVGWDTNKIEALLSALSYSKLGRKSDEEIDKLISFSFVHRRFHEYFCARYLKREYHSAPFEQLNSDNRWREILVLLCEVLPKDLLTKVFDQSLMSLKEGISAEFGTENNKKALETILFLKDAFKSRIEDVPKEIRIACSNFITKQFQDKNLLNQKRALEALIIADTDSAHSIIESAFKQNSRYLNETAFRSCRVLERIPMNISVAIRQNLFLKYFKLDIYKQYEYYSILFSTSKALKPLGIFLKILLISMIFQILFIIGFSGYPLVTDSKNIIEFVIIILLFLLTYLFCSILTYESLMEVNYANTVSSLLFFPLFVLLNPLSSFSIVSLVVYFSFSNSNKAWFLWSIPIIVSFLLQRMIYFENMSTALLYVKTMLNRLKLRYISKFLLYFFIVISVFILYILFISVTSVYIAQGNRAYYLINFLFLMIENILLILIYIQMKYLLKYWKTNNSININMSKNLLFFITLFLEFIGLLFTARVITTLQQDGTLSFLSGLNALDAVYTNYNYFLAYIIIMADVLLILELIVAVFWTFFKIFILPAYHFVKDELRLNSLAHKVRKNEISTDAALNGLNLFKTETSKNRYIQILIYSLPVNEKHLHLIFNEAFKSKGETRDSLFQLAEIWENSIDKKY